MIAVSVRSAFFTVGALKTGTPLLIASTPVMAVQPLANARARSQRLAASACAGTTGGADTGIPRHRQVLEPYDSLSFVPTILDLMGMPADAAKLPGRPIQEVLTGTQPLGSDP